MTTTRLRMKSIYFWAFSFRVLVYYHNGKEHGGMQAGMVLEKEPRVLHLDWQAAGRERERVTLGLA